MVCELETTIQEMGHRSTDAVPLCSLVSEHAEMGVAHVVYHFISGRHVELIAEPVHCHVSRAHGVKHEILQVLQGLGRGEKRFCFHETIISTGSDALGVTVCHLVNWLGSRPIVYTNSCNAWWQQTKRNVGECILQRMACRVQFVLPWVCVS